MTLSSKLIYSFVFISLFVCFSVSQPVGEEVKSKEDVSTTSDVPKIIPTAEKADNKIKEPTQTEKDNKKENSKEILKETPRDLKTEESSSLPEKSSESSITLTSSSSPLQIFSDCKGSLECTEQKLVSVIDRVDSERSVPLFYGLVSVERTTEEENDKEPETPKSQEGLLSRLDRYLDTHCLRLHISGMEEDSSSRSLDFSMDSLKVSGDASEARSRSKWSKILLPVVIVFELIFFAIVPFFLSAIAIFSVIALQAGLGGILISAFVGLKSILSSEKDNRNTRVTVVKPHVVPDVYHSDLLHGWSRSGLLDSYRGGLNPSVDSYRGGFNPSVDPYRGYSSSSWDRPTL